MKNSLLITFLFFGLVQSAQSAIDFVVGAPYTSPVRSLCGAGNDCALRTTEDHEYQVVIPSAGSYTFDLCGSSFDTYLYIGTTLCSSNIGLNDDFCGLQSSITVSIAAGTYYVTVEGYSGCGNYVLNITGPPPPPPANCYSQLAVPYSPAAVGGTSVALTDDTHSGVVPIGFNFCYFGTNYNQAVISSNNYLSFNLANANTYSPYSTVAVPSTTPTELRNAIMGPWQDINPGVGGTVNYQTVGTAPNRSFILSYTNVPMFSCTGLLYSSQIILREGSNCIETHIITKPICATWNSGNAVHAIQDLTGTVANVVPGRNNTAWAIASEGTLWTPNCGTCMTATSPTCAIVLLPVEVANFNGVNQDRKNILNWTTLSETNNDYFMLERSIDGVTFEPIAKIEGMGNTTEATNYSFIDEDPFSGVNYYRLKQTDFDGSSEYQEAIAISVSSDNKLVVYPSPASNFITVSLDKTPKSTLQALVRNTMGQVVMEFEINDKNEVLNIANFNSGLYFIEVTIDGSQTFRRFVKN